MTDTSDASKTPAPSSSGVAALDRAFAILFAFRQGDRSLSLAEIAGRTGLYKSTILRLIGSLTHHNMMLRLDDGRYCIGPTTLQLGALYQRSLQLGDVLLPIMRRLRDLSGESVAFYIKQNDLRVCLHRVDSNHTIRDHVREGDVLPMDLGSGGHVLSAFSGASGALFEQIRDQCFCAAAGERDVETAGISVPVFSAAQPVAGALTLAGPRSRLEGSLTKRMCGPLLEAAVEASRVLGGDTARLQNALEALRRREATAA